MNATINDVKSLVSGYLGGDISLEAFREAFASLLRFARQYEEPTRDLIWAVDHAIARFGTGQWSADQIRKELHRLAYVQFEKEPDIKSGSSIATPQAFDRVEYPRSLVETGPALEYVK